MRVDLPEGLVQQIHKQCANLNTLETQYSLLAFFLEVYKTN